MLSTSFRVTVGAFFPGIYSQLSLDQLDAIQGMSSSGFDRTNSYVVSEHVTTQRQSSISYSKTWEGTTSDSVPSQKGNWA
jgi:hypothetical protein